MHDDQSKPDKMRKRGHMLFSDSAALAQEAGAKTLWLTHYSPALIDPVAHITRAREIFPQTIAGYDGIKTSLGSKKSRKES